MADKDDIDGFDGDSDAGNNSGVENPSASEIAQAVADRLNIAVTTEEEVEVKSDLFIYKADCLSCSHLIKNVEGVKTKPFRCTTANGNERCPAAVVEISVGANVEKIAKSIYSAYAKMNMEKYSSRIARLAKYPASVQRVVMERVEQLQIAGKSA